MTDPLIPNSGEAASRYMLRHALAVALGVLVVFVMLLTSGQMAELRVALPPLSNALNWLDALPGPFDVCHVVFFALVAAGLRVMLPAASGWALLALLGALAVGTELLQFATVGRTPKLLDVRDDMIGAGIGLLLGSVPKWCRGGARHLEHVSTWLVVGGIAMLPIQQWPLASVLGFPVLVSDAFFVLALALRGFALATGNAPIRLSGFHGWLALYLLAMLLAVLVVLPSRWATPASAFVCTLPSPDYLAAIGKWVGVVYLASLAALVCDLARRPADATRMAVAWVTAALAASLVSLIAMVAFYADREAGWLQPLLNHYGSLPPGDYPRLRTGFNYASMFANFLLVGVALSWALYAQGRIGTRMFVASLLVMGVGAAPSLTPGLGGIPLALGLAAWWTWRALAPARARIGLVVGLVPAMAMLLVASRSLLAPFDTPSQRWMIWSDAVATVWASPWHGVGLAQDVVGVAYRDPSGGDQWLTDAHNIWLNIAGQAGLPATLAFAGLCAWLCVRGLRAAKAGNTLAAGALLALVVGVFYDGLTGSFEDARHVWVLIGLLAGTATACARPESPRASPT